MRQRFWQTAKSPVYVILLGGILALCLSSYPVVFLGKSFVSPGYGPQMLYDQLPLVPGYQSTETEDLSADAGAMPWQNLPYSRVQSESIFQHGEFPLWNRYNSSGVPLFGQGQSQILDPLHWIAVVGQGNNWAWDIKFLISKLIFLLGIGACVFLLTRSRLIAITLMVSSAFIGFYYYRFNHPVFFNLTYASWIIFFYLLWIENIRTVHRLVLSSTLAIPIVGVFLASVLHLFAGTPKEGAILFLASHLAGLIGVGLSGFRAADRVRQMGLLLLLWLAIALAAAPHWLTFLETLTVASTAYDNANCNYSSRLWQFVDTLFLGEKSRPWSQPNINVFIFVAAVHALFGGRTLYKRPEFWLVVVPLAGLLGFAFGLISNELCQKIPFVGRIHHIDDAFFTAAIPFAIILAGLGLHRFLQDLSSGPGMVRSLSITLVTAGVLVYWAHKYYDSAGDWLSAAGMLAASGIAGTILFFLSAPIFLSPRGSNSRTGAITLTVLFAAAHFYHGLHPETGWKELDQLIINPTPRADMLKPSPAVSALGYLLPTNPNFFQEIECGEALPSDGFEAYVDRYPDLLKAFNRSGTKVKKADWGKGHYCTFGRAEGRMDWERPNSSKIIDSVLALSRSTNGRVGEIEKYKNDLERAIKSSSSYAHVQHHVARFLKGVGAGRWGAGPARVLGIGRTPMSGFYAFLKLESLNGPDALMNQKYLEFLDLMGWSRVQGDRWLRTMDSIDARKHSSLLDVLNVGYLMSWKTDLETMHLVSDYTRYSDISVAPQIAGPQKSPHLALARRDFRTDRVACKPRGLEQDGLDDNVFSADIHLPKALLPGAITALRLDRKSPGGVNHTGGNDFVLGVAIGADRSLINRDDGGIELPVSTSSVRLWLFGCADGLDNADTEYRVRAAFRSEDSALRKLTKVIDLDMKVWERKDAWPRAFFVDDLAKYDSPEALAGFLKESGGLPLAAVMSNEILPPVVDRRVMPANTYKITNNTTSFDIVAHSAGVIVLSEAHLPGHVHATINDEPADVFVVNHAFSGIHVSKPGHYQVSFSYRPPRWSLSWFLSVAGCLLLAVMTYLLRRSKSVSFSSGPEDRVYRENHQNE
jgi:hypothetical protein|tara:strand:+ start:786 stop:4076 length:3291 start_codon:yes stop_codon:yes gene_type:complete